LPFSDKEEIYTTAVNGRLHQTKNVWVADGSSLKYVPAKGISFTLMANADRVAKHALNNR
jgi:choline dehydrogenase-like flavoprotein